MMKRWIGMFLVIAMCLSNVGVFATPTFDDLYAVQSAGDYEALEALVRQEADVDASLKESITLAVGDVPRGAVEMDRLGLQCEIRGHGEEFFNSDTNEFTDGYLKLADELYDVPVARWGGGSSNHVNWWNNVGPLSERKDTYNVVTGEFLGGATDVGIVEYIKAIYAINPEAKFIITLPIWGQTPEESRTFTHFLLDEKDASEYGALRASYGIEEPIELVGFELGNENYFSAKYDYTGSEEEGDAGESDSGLSEDQKTIEIAYAKEKATEYTDRCALHIDEVRKDFPEVAFYPCVSGGHNDRVYADPWTQTIAQNLDTRINGLAFHDYYNGVYNVAGDYSEMEHIKSTYAAAAASGRTPNLVLTEHGIWSTGNTIYRRSHYAALTEAAFINNILWRDDIICANYHNFTGEHWSLFRRFGDKYAQDSVNYVYKMYESKLGTQLLDTTESTDLDEVSALATRRNNGQVVLALVNGYQDREVDLTFAFNQEYDLVYESVYTAPHNMSFMYSNDVADIFKVTETAKNVENITTYTLPNKSVVFLTLEPSYDVNTLLKDDFESYDVMNSSVTITSPETSKAIVGNWTLTHQSGAGYVNKNVTAQIVANDTKRLAVSDSNIAATDKRLVVAERQNIGNTLEGDFIIDFSVNKGSVLNGASLRFMIHNNGKNYYQLTLGGGQEGYVWVFNKVVNNTVSATYQGEQVTDYDANPGGYLHNNQTVRVKKTGNTISWEIFGNRYNNHSYYGSGSHTDTSPFSVTGTNPTFGFTVNRSSSSGTVYFDDVEIYQHVARSHAAGESAVFVEQPIKAVEKNQADVTAGDVFVTSGEPDDVIYASLSGTKQGSVTELSQVAPIRKIVNNGSTAANVYVSMDDFSYKKLAAVPAGETFVNTLTAKEYAFVKTEGGDVTLYTTLDDLAMLSPYADMPKLLARIGGVDVPDAEFEVSDTRLAKLEGAVLCPINNGTVTVRANKPTAEEDLETASFTEDFASYTNSAVVQTPTETGVAGNTIAGNWQLCRNDGVVTTNPTAYIQDGVLGMTGASIALSDNRLGYAVLNKTLPGMNKDYTISFTGNKVSTTSGMAIKFHMHDDDKSYYQLSFCGVSDPYYVWRFDKVEKGTLVSDATVLGPTFQSYNTNGNGPLHGTFDVTIRVNHGEISWTISGKRYNNKAYSASGSYTDAKFCELHSEDVRFGFAVNCNNSGYSRVCTFDNITVTGKKEAPSVVKEIEIQDMELFSEDFSSYENTQTVSTPLGWAVRQYNLAGDWYLKRNGGTVNTNPTAYIQDGVLGMTGASLGIGSGSLSYVVYDKALPALPEDYTISFTGDKVSVTSGVAIKFHMHDNDQSYYQLSLCGTSDAFYVWRFDKVEKGARIGAATILGPSFSAYNADNDGPMHGNYAISVRVNRGEISWAISGKRYNNRTYTASGSYTDPDFCALKSEDVRFGFAVNCNSGGYTRVCTFDNIEVTGRTIDDVRVQETENGNYLFVNQDAFPDDVRVIQTYTDEMMLKRAEIYQKDTWQNVNHATLFIPKSEFAKAKVLTWDTSLNEVEEAMTENGK